MKAVTFESTHSWNLLSQIFLLTYPTFVDSIVGMVCSKQVKVKGHKRLNKEHIRKQKNTRKMDILADKLQYS